MTKVKICGNTNLQDAKKAVELGADYLGFIFTASKRKVVPDSVKEIMGSIPNFENYVAVFYNQPKHEVEKIAKALNIKFLQFHGDETALYCNYFMEQGYQVIKTFHIKDKMSLKRIDEYDVSAFLFDTYHVSAKGGTGATFDWNLIEDHPYVHEKLFLAGGLNTSNLKQGIDKLKPFAVDVASGVEKSPGVKDYAMLEKFIKIAKGSI